MNLRFARAGLLVARTGAVLFALAVLAWFVVTAQADARRGHRGPEPTTERVPEAAGRSAPGESAPGSPAPGNETPYIYGSKSVVLPSLAPATGAPPAAEPTYLFSSKSALLPDRRDEPAPAPRKP